ncbi:hypothetical protein [Terricaulis sp.]|uniref:hypothetical protein n=1 Tax=Terricaulis sp. TaxID=2768686 RepID=UPI002AC769A5|nr:hypothetical protein [Terricaulis sp.]MDZ4690713.1 hypothetical protein [Terricaulis sp.]
MGWWARGGAAGTRIVPRVLAVLVVAGCQLGIGNAQTGFSADQCRRSPIERGRENPLERHVNVSPERVLSACSRIAQDPRARADQQVNAQYYTARAIATLHEEPGAREPAELANAAEMLNRVVLAPWPQSEPAQLRAHVQLARVVRLQLRADRARGGLVDRRRVAEAMALLDRPLLSATPESAAVVLDARYERALLLMERGEPGDDEAALRDLSMFANSTRPSSAWSVTGERGRGALVELAQRLGNQAMDAAPTQANVERALDYYARAQTAVETGGAPAGVNVPDIYINLGAATLRRAAIARGLSADRRCENTGVDVDATLLLRQARAYFETARTFTPHSSRAEQGSGCASLAMGNLNEALISFQAAQQAGASDIDSVLELADAYAEVGAILQVQQPQSAPHFWNLAEQTYQRGIAMLSGDAVRRRRASVNVDWAGVRQARGDLAGAMQVLSAALADQPNAPEALLARGRLICGGGVVRRDVNCANLDPVSTLDEARADLNGVIDQVPTPEPPLRGQAHYYLSHLANRSISAGGDGWEAVRHADAAFSLAPSATYREHACLMRIRYYHLRGVGQRDERLRDEGTRYCLAGESRTPSALLLEGEYHLSRARSLPGGARDRAREEAYRTFGEGLRVLGGSEEPAVRQLRYKLELGQAFVQYCLGLEGVGIDAIRRIDPDQTIRQHFIDHDVWNCQAR